MLNITITAYPLSWGEYAIRPYLFPSFKSSVLLLIGIFLSTNTPLIMISSRMTWCSHQTMNAVWQELTPPSLSLMYTLLIIFHANLRQKSSSVGIPS